MLRAAVGNTLRLEVETVGIDEETLANADSGVVVSVTRADGTKLADITVAANNGTVGKYNVDFTAATYLTRVDTLSCSLTYTVSGFARRDDFEVRVVGGRFFSIRELRAMNQLGDTAQFPTGSLVVARDIAEEFIEDFTAQAWVPRSDVLTQTEDLSAVFLPYLPVRSLVRLLADETALVAADASVSPSGRLELPETATTPSESIVVEYEHGEATPPADLVLAAKRLARHLLFSGDSSIPDRARMMVTDWGTFALDIASEEKPTGLPEVDSVLRRYRFARSVPFA